MNGFALFGILATIEHKTSDGWSGCISLPTFYVLGGNASDAEVNARTVIGFREGWLHPKGGKVVKINVHVNSMAE